ncbi:DUF411 domain-containing protein [Fodinibius halophilus]|uniref:DUF411 domain-containing protein n=1 Tax=Fodinibius halophilus TaxID=1736908 RepID=A0A6M1T0C7_9BACT|nr:DUF411 domain-containing protein [Fodinibius halophilus]NGP88936.1 DUF411 domain-containing protein [Fodinibius halophilus]
MKTSRFLAAAAAIILVAGGAIWYIVNDYYANQPKQQQQADVVMYKNEGCSCCERWANYMQDNGYTVNSINAENLYALKAEEGISQNLGSCHTAIVGDYVVEGHVPAEDIKRLLREQPDAKGLVVPGMPESSPGMNTALNKPYDVLLLKNDGSTEVFAQH